MLKLAEVKSRNSERQEEDGTGKADLSVFHDVLSDELQKPGLVAQ